jgi:ceramide glucosyltransferase
MNIDALLSMLVAVCLAGAVFGCLYMMLAGLFVLRLGRTRSQPHRPAPASAAVPVSILVPLCGHEPGLKSRLRDLCSQDYPGPIQLICGVRDAADPAAAVIDMLAAELPPGSIELIRDPRLHGRNFKMSNLMNMMERVAHDVLIMVDSDIRVGADYVARVVAELQKPKVGAVTCLYTGVPAGGLWAQLAAMDINLQFLPNAILALALGLARPCFGATIAIRRETLREIGGLARFADQLWDDYAIGEAVRAAGYRVAVPAYVVAHVSADTSARDVFARELRSARTIARIDRAGHMLGSITHPFALAVMAMLLGGGEPALALALASLAARVGLAVCMTHRFATPARFWWLLPVRDIASFAVFLLSFLGRTVVWRGRRYRVDADGTLLHAPR